MTRCAVLGAGAWGTALADLLARNGHPVRLWAYEWDVVETINRSHENRRFLSGHKLSADVTAWADVADAVDGAELVTVATPSHVLRPIVRSARDAFPARVPIVVASKGIEAESLALMTDVISAEVADSTVVALSGPSFAVEVANRQPTAVVVASADAEAARFAQQTFSATDFRAYTHSDVTGVEIGGALKNVMAVATGIAEGLGLGFNARAALITRGLAEMTRLGTRLGAEATTLAGLAGMGDLVLTCTGTLSRNRSVGVEMGRGASLEEVLAGKETVAEGVITTRSARALAAREGVEMPIVDAVYRVLFEGHPPRDAIGSLMTRELRSESD
ncbi:MAG TPA: NAD(P)H-dependent glycerol-3-phosphate dehydrogenase [Gemmatimonadaceae bacterium]|nr:NAD(P)H-dependent glycerol-3-phosphate dehydrogenase [Gemmatimonadaceae bacterium]